MAEMSIGDGERLVTSAKRDLDAARTQVQHLTDLRLAFAVGNLTNALNSGMNTSALRDAHAAALRAKNSSHALAAELNNVINLVNRALR